MVRVSLPSTRIKLHVIYNFMIRPAHGTFVVLQGLSLFRLFLFVAATFLLLLSPLLLSLLFLFQFQKNGRGEKLMRGGYPNPISVLQNYTGQAIY